MKLDCKNKDYSEQSYNIIADNLSSIFKLLKTDISEYCDINISVSINGGKVSGRIDTTVHHIHKIKRADNG
ncbi:MAG TPA: hypothetical protein DHW42_03135 [Candidatus Marinimicrobia bacterium]|nr:hypothetical protein [Candidatus Neomarinimicrobiota bacterium]